jgi:Icc-related predicted phosphoesterase
LTCKPELLPVSGLLNALTESFIHEDQLMKCIAVSDTHGKHADLQIPDGDVLIHAGDILRCGLIEELEIFNEWLGTLPHRHKLIIAGNHDWCFERKPVEARKILTNGSYLQDEAVSIDGLVFYGSPWQPAFMNWAFNLPRGKKIARKWDQIPHQTDVLITHGPSYGILDECIDGKKAGCEELVHALKRIKPRYHVFGHIHEGYGVIERNGVTYVNASINTHLYQPSNLPISFIL